MDLDQGAPVALVETDFADGVYTITLNDVEHHNTLSRQLVSELVGAIDVVDADPQIRVAVLTNRGSIFCAGADLRERTQSREGDENGASVELSTLLQRFRNSPKPFVGRIAGHCIAGGVGLAAVLDISIAVDSAKFGFSEVRVGVVPATISVVCLPKMKLADAQSAFLRGQRFLAPEAARMGLITTAVAAADLDRELVRVINDLLAGEPRAIALAKQLTTFVPSLTSEEAFLRMTQLINELFESDAAQEGMTAFLEKRPASWVRTLPEEG
jgi:methylglutaconyl-CoA hydratase